MKVNVLGTDYTIRKMKRSEEPAFDEQDIDGYCDRYQHLIVYLDLDSDTKWDGEPEKTKRECEKSTIRHEIVHAFIFESGLSESSHRAERSRFIMRKLLFFHADWCKPCIFYEKQFITPLEERAGIDKIIRINAQNEPFKAEKYLIDKLPAVILLDGENVKMRRTGAINIDEIAGFLKGVKDYD